MENKSVSVLIDTWLVQIIPAYQDIIFQIIQKIECNQTGHLDHP